jgi:outer membrane protein OmpA-like peptidoglycan-associated protein
MRLKMTIGMLAGLGLLLVPNTSHASDVTLKVEPGVAVSTSTPQASRFNAGGDISVKALFGLTPWLDVGPSVSFLALDNSNRTDQTTGTALGLGGGARVKRPHDASNKGEGLGAVSPWVDADAQYIRTGNLDRAGVSIGAGASVPTSDARTLWVGPFARYQDIVQSPKQGFDSTDAHVIIVGVSLEFGPKAVKKVEPPCVEKEVVLSDRDHDGTPDVTDRCPDVPGPKDNFGCPYPVPVPTPVVGPPVVFELKQKVQFAWDSSVLKSSEHPALEEVTKSLLANKDYTVKIEGHASSEGQTERNNKLAQRRADEVAAYLVKNGVSKDRVTATGFGSSRPIATNETNVGRVSNRRVEFVVTIVVVKGGNQN